MQAIEFTTTVHNGMIKIPQEYRSAVRDEVRVIIMKEEIQLAQKEKLIEFLKSKPFSIQNFVPLKREDIYASRK